MTIGEQTFISRLTERGFTAEQAVTQLKLAQCRDGLDNSPAFAAAFDAAMIRRGLAPMPTPPPEPR